MIKIARVNEPGTIHLHFLNNFRVTILPRHTWEIDDCQITVWDYKGRTATHVIFGNVVHVVHSDDELIDDLIKIRDFNKKISRSD